MSTTSTSSPETNLHAHLPVDAAGIYALAAQIRSWGAELGFDVIRTADVDPSRAGEGFQTWLAQGFHGDMGYMVNHGMSRARPAELVAGAVHAIAARMSYLPYLVDPQTPGSDWRTIEWDRLRHPEDAAISFYTRGRDYHKVLCQRLQRLARKTAGAIGPYDFRAFTDSASMLEVALATNGDLGWRGKHTLLPDRDAGSMLFLGEILVDLSFPVGPPVEPHYGNCTRYIDIYPTQTIIAPYTVDAHRCISYLTIKCKGSIPVELHPAMGNHVYGCDSCQLICPWSRFAIPANLADFNVHNGLDATTLAELFSWADTEFNQRLEGGPIRRIGHERWLRNTAMATSNTLRGPLLDTTCTLLTVVLHVHANDASGLMRERVAWVLVQ